MVGAILVSHENLSQSIVEALEKITGESRDIIPISSKGISPRQLEEEIISAIGALKNNEGIILFTDLYGGSCSHICHRVQRENPDVIIITGVNLPLLIDFVFQRSKPAREIVDRLVQKGRAGIKLHIQDGEEGETR
ncbi:MAG: PTS sugar transporter subunit IIA [Candidatus Glassbacteria bacterium]